MRTRKVTFSSASQLLSPLGSRHPFVHDLLEDEHWQSSFHLAKCHKHTYLRKSKVGKSTFLQIADMANFQILESNRCLSGASAEIVYVEFSRASLRRTKFASSVGPWTSH